MGKRKYHEDEHYIEKEIKRLKRKRSKIRRGRRERRERHHRSYSSSSSYSDRDVQYSDGAESDHRVEDYDDESSSPIHHRETSLYKGAPADDDDTFVKLCNAPTRPRGSSEPPPAPCSTPLPRPQPTVASQVTTVPTTAPAEAAAPPDTPVPELDPSILSILGDEPISQQKFGPEIHKDLASRWSDILINGLQDDTKNGIIKSYDPPENFKIVQAPLMNAEVKAAVNENVLKRDSILVEKQKLLASAITSVASTISAVLSADTETDSKNNILKSLCDTGRLLCHIHYSETQVRRNFLLACLSKEVKENIKDLKRDHLLFGNDLLDNLKSMKAITKTGAELRPTNTKPKLPPKNRQPEPSTSRALNWRGPPPPPPAPPRRNPARLNSVAGGRRQAPRARRPSDRRAPRGHPRTSRR